MVRSDVFSTEHIDIYHIGGEKMKTILRFILLILALSMSASAQIRPAPRDGNPQVRQPSENVRQNQRDLSREAQRRAEMDRLNKLDREKNEGGGKIPDWIKTKITEEYRFPNETEINVIRPLPEDMETYKDFLKSTRTGIVRFANVDACKNIKGCTVNPMPGNASSFSFRVANYRTPSMSDLIFKDGDFSVTGVLDHGYLISLGDVSLDLITNKYDALSPLKKFKPSKNIKDFKEVEKELSKKPEIQKANGAVNNTYALRSVAYNGTALRTISNFSYNALVFDTRSDVLVVFRVIRKHDDGSMTVLWKLIDKHDSPMLK